MHMSQTLLALKSCYITSARAGAAFRLHIYIEAPLLAGLGRARAGLCNALHRDSRPREYDIDAVLDNRGASGLAVSRKRLNSGAEQAETSKGLKTLRVNTAIGSRLVTDP